jgi:hypothetical protein
MVGYLPGMWHDFGVTIGSLAGALTGLLFVAVSIKSDTLSKSVSLRSRAAQTLVLFMTSALAAIVLVAPQPGDALGGELVALAAVSGATLYVLDRRGGHDQTSRVARYSNGRHRTRSRRCCSASPASPSSSRPAAACTG